jgi:hypothetical protein
MISDGFSIGHLTLSISFESEVSTNLSPTFFIDFAPVFIYVTFIETGNSVVTSRSSAPSKSLIDKSAPFRTIRFNAGFPQPTGSRACGIDESQTAAEQVFVAQSSLSHQIGKLEDNIELPIFDRLQNGLQLTAAGRIIASYAENTLREWDQTHIAVQNSLIALAA